MNFQVTILKILVSYPDGFAAISGLKRDMAILATSGPDWAARTKRLGLRVPGLDIFSQKLVVRENGGWKITEKGRSVLAFMEARLAADPLSGSAPGSAAHSPIPPLPPLADRAERRRERKKRRREARERARTSST